MNIIPHEALTFDDVLILPGFSEVLPTTVSTRIQFTKKISLYIPIISAAMDTITEAKTAIVMAQEGGLGIIHKNLSIKDQAFEVEKVKKSEWGMIIDPITIDPDATLAKANELMSAYKISGIPVVVPSEHGKKLVGIITNRDMRFEEEFHLLVKSRMTPSPLVTAPEGTSLADAKNILREKRIEKLPVVDANGCLTGLITIKDIQKQRA